jgi:hypothetical protein
LSVMFYFAIGREYRRRDLEIAIACGQRHFLVPVGTLAAQRLRDIPDIHIALDSAAYPPGNPNRISLAAYWQEVLCWRRAPGDWGCLDWFASYDTIGDAAQTLRDEQILRQWIVRDAPDAPLLRVVGFGMPLEQAAATILANPLNGPPRPSYGIGGLALQRYNATAEAWYQALLDKLERTDDDALAGVGLHLFGVARPSWVLRSKCNLIASCDSSGPGRMAGIAGWSGIAARFTPLYGVSAEKLQCSREARLYFHLCRYRRSLRLPWTPLDESLFQDDVVAPPGIQHTLVLEPAMVTGEGRDVTPGGWPPQSACEGLRTSASFRSQKLRIDR